MVRVVRVTSRPTMATPATMTLAGPRPIAGTNATKAYVPMKAPIFPAAAAMPQCRNAVAKGLLRHGIGKVVGGLDVIRVS
jgi:hypothetical protein